jgi:predicted SprT family Zn-dependent metalloprotease
VGGRCPPTLEYCAELQRAWEHFTAALFDASLPPCLITLQRKSRTRGYFSPARFARVTGEIVDEIAMNPAYFAIQPLKVTLSTLVHELTHEQQYHVGQPGRHGYHNVQWAEMMEAIGLMPSSTGAPGGKRLGERMSHYVVDDGPFDRACDALLTDAFMLSWFDRFVPPRPAPKPVDDPIEPADPSSADDDQDLPSPAIAALLVELESSNRSNRIKYRCPSCSAQVWGKPELLLKCGRCGDVTLDATD